MPAAGTPVELEPGEEVRATAFASFRGAAATSTRATFGWAPSAKRRRTHREWADAVTSAGFPETPPDMVLAATDRRLLVGKPTLWGRKPAYYTAALDYDRIAQVVAARHGLVVGIAFAFEERTSHRSRSDARPEPAQTRRRAATCPRRAR